MTQKEIKEKNNFKTRIEESDPFIFWAAVLLLIVSILAIVSASMNVQTTVETTFSAFIEQLIFSLVGMSVYFFAVCFYSTPILKKINNILMTGGILSLIIACISTYTRYKGEGINGSFAWIFIIGEKTIQPSEFVKVITILFIAISMGDKEYHSIKKPIEVFWKPVCAVIVCVIIIVFLQKDNGSAVILTIIAATCFMIPKNKLYIPLKKGIILLTIFAIFAFIFAFTESGQKALESIGFGTVAARFNAVLNPSYEEDSTREIFYSLLGISKGGLTGVGFGDSVQKFGYLVSSSEDYIFSIIVEETGMIGIVIVFTLYMTIILRLFHYAAAIKKETGRTILVGTAMFFSVHFILNIGGVSGFMPLTGVPLLLLSSGGSSLTAAMISLGVCQNIISKYKIARKEANKPL